MLEVHVLNFLKFHVRSIKWKGGVDCKLALYGLVETASEKFEKCGMSLLVKRGYAILRM